MATKKYKVKGISSLPLLDSPSVNGKTVKNVSKGTALDIVDGYKKTITENGVSRTYFKVKLKNKKVYAESKYLKSWKRADQVVYAAKKYSKEMLKGKWYYRSSSHKAGKTFEASKKGSKGSSCAYFASWCMQFAGVVKPKGIVSHTKAGGNKNTISKVMTGKSAIKNGKIIFPVNKSIAKYKDKLKPGDIIIHDSSIEVYIGKVNGKPTVISGRNGAAINKNGRYVKMKFTSGYEFTHNILAIVRPKG